MIGTPIGKNVIELDETDSTNSYASRLLHDQYPLEGTAILAHFQTSGRGQRASGWESSPHKNLLVSYILYPDFIPVNSHFAFSQAVALAVADCIHELTREPVHIKWPNDILIKKNKIAGILIENSLRGVKIVNSVVGIGINVNQTHFIDYEPIATSIKTETGLDTEVHLVLDVLSKHLSRWYQLLRLGHLRQIKDAYHQLLFQINVMATFATEAGTFEGIIQGVTEDGKLHIVKNDGTSHFFMNKEVKFLF